MDKAYEKSRRTSKINKNTDMNFKCTEEEKRKIIIEASRKGISASEHIRRVMNEYNTRKSKCRKETVHFSVERQEKLNEFYRLISENKVEDLTKGEMLSCITDIAKMEV